MTTNHKPATPLPWSVPVRYGNTMYELQGTEKQAVVLKNCQFGTAEYIAHAANAYPRLIEALRFIRDKAPTLPMPAETFDDLGIDEAKALLRELGEE